MSAAFIYKYALIVILGHYGSGKTNLALNLALRMREQGKEPTLVDLDVVNPYFRTTDYQEFAEAEGIKVSGPVFGNSNLDAPSLPPGIDAAIKQASLDGPVILDVGGDSDGARALVRYVPAIKTVENRLIAAVVNTRRPQTRNVEDNLEMLHELSDTVDLELDALIGNTHLAEFTTYETVRDSLNVLEELAALSGVPLLAVTIPDTITLQDDGDLFLPIKRIVKTNWQ